MPDLILVSLDALLDVPVLMADAFVRACERRADQAHVLSLLAQKQCEEKRVAQVLAKVHRYDEGELLGRFYRELPVGAHKRVYEDAHVLLAATAEFPQCLFYAFPDEPLRRVARNANFHDIRIEGARSGETARDVASRLAAGLGEVCYIVGSLVGKDGDLEEERGMRVRPFHTSRYDIPLLLDELGEGA